MLLLLLACDPAEIDIGKSDSMADSAEADADTDTDTDSDTDADTDADTDTDADADTGTPPTGEVYTGEVSAQFMTWGANGATQQASCTGTARFVVATDDTFTGTADCVSQDVNASGPLSGTIAWNSLTGEWKPTVWGTQRAAQMWGTRDQTNHKIQLTFNSSSDGFQGQGSMKVE
jgi:hypothetical protein